MDYQQETLLQNNSDEIDLIAVFEKIWQGKVLIAGIVLISAFVGFVVLSVMPSYYRIEATIDRAAQLRLMWPATLESKAYQVVSELQSNAAIFDGKEYQVPVPDEKKIYDTILLQASSFSMLKSFWEFKSGKLLELGPGAPTTDEARAFEDFFNGFLLESSNPKALEITARKISFENQDPSKGVTLLNEYLAYLNQHVWVDQLATIEAIYTANLKALNTGYEARNVIEQRKLSDEILKLRENLKIAESLNIKETPFKELENIQLKILDSRDYLLGTKTLSQQLEILVARQGKSLSPFATDLRSMEIWREQMIADVQRFKDLNGKINLFSVVNKPESTLDPIKPKRTLIFIAVVFISGCLGIFIVLFRSAIQSKKSQAR